MICISQAKAPELHYKHYKICPLLRGDQIPTLSLPYGKH